MQSYNKKDKSNCTFEPLKGNMLKISRILILVLGIVVAAFCIHIFL